jgi:cell division protein FtsB
MSTKVKCVVCNQEVDVRGIKLHMLQLHQITGKETNVSTLEDSAKLKEEISTKTTELAQLKDSLNVKDIEIANLKDSIIKNQELKENELATLNDQILYLRDLAKNNLENLTQNAWLKIGQHNHFTDQPAPAPLTDSAPAAANNTVTVTPETPATANPEDKPAVTTPAAALGDAKPDPDEGLSPGQIWLRDLKKRMEAK